jgi:hypothetical protein
MPIFQRLLEKANRLFASDSIASVHSDALAPRELSQHLLADCADALGMGLTSDERDFVSRTPVSIQEAIRGVCYTAVVRSRMSVDANEPLQKIPITFAWIPQYDYELVVVEARRTASSWGGITILLRTPYPS